MKLRIITVAALSSFCYGSVLAADRVSSQDDYMNSFKALCGQAFKGKLLLDNSKSSSFSGKEIILHIRDCKGDQLKMPMHVGDDHSRIFIMTKLKNAIHFTHDHRHEDGSEDELTLYGGMTETLGTKISQDFIVDGYSKIMFVKLGYDVSVTNTWIISLEPGKSITYRLTRPNREFQIKFDLNKPVKNPPKAWDLK